VQAQLRLDRPDYGVLFEDMQIANSGELPGAQLLQPKAEAEVALVMAHDLDNPRPSLHDVLAKVAYALPAIEIVDSRIADWKITFADTVADNGSSARFVLGNEPRTLAGLDLETCGMVLEINGKLVSMGTGAACLGHPLLAAAWLARTLMEAGDYMLTSNSQTTIGVLMDRNEIAALLGVTPRTISDFAREGRLPAYRFNEKLTRFRRDDVVKFIESAKYHPRRAVA
jgi:excisionase family DNA binding protein